MTTASIANVPANDAELQSWSFAHNDLCQRMISYLNNKNGTSIVVQQLDPVPTFDFKNWLGRVQDVHNSINVPLGVVGDDLTDLDPQDKNQLQAWIGLVFSEAQRWTSITGIA